ncbi:MAG: hypothetical protein U9O18_09740, partial [Chloroflexota bacterium]|nr:hypothetical protein [Chloroflexota bacterium]
MRPARVGTFADRVMAQVSQEPKPTPARVFVRSLLALRPGAAVATLATAWHLAFGRTRAIPSLVRFQSLTLLLVLAVVVGTGGTLATAGALRVIDRPADPTTPPLPVIVVGPSPAPTASPAPSASPSTSPTPDVEIAQEPERRTEEVLPAPRKRNQAQESGTDSGDKKRSKDAGEQQKKQPDRDSSGEKKQDQSQDGSDRIDGVVKQP